MRNRKLVAEWCYEHGRADNVIEWVRQDGKTYVVVNDFVRLRALFGELLGEIQRIKSEGDYEAGRDLVERYAVRVDPALPAVEEGMMISPSSTRCNSSSVFSPV